MGTEATDQNYYTMTIYSATLTDQDKYKLASWIPGEVFRLNNPMTGYLKECALLTEHFEVSSIQSGHGVSEAGMGSVTLREGDTELISKISRARNDWVVMVFRQWKLVQTDPRLYHNNKGTAVWGKLKESYQTQVNFEVHTAADMVNNGGEVTLSSIDYPNAGQVYQNHNLRPERLPHMLDPVDADPADKWSPNIITF